MVGAGEIVCTPVVPWVLLASRFAGETTLSAYPGTETFRGFLFRVKFPNQNLAFTQSATAKLISNKIKKS